MGVPLTRSLYSIAALTFLMALCIYLAGCQNTGDVRTTGTSNERVQELLGYLSGEQMEGQLELATELARYCADPVVLETVREAGSSEDVTLRLWANYILWSIDDERERRLEFMIERLKEGNPEERGFAEHMMANWIDPERDISIVPQLLDAYRSSDPNIRKAVVRALVHFPNAPGVREVYLFAMTEEVVGSEEVNVPMWAVGKIEVIARNEPDYRHDSEIISTVMHLFEAGSILQRTAAVNALREFNPTPEIVTVLVEASNDPEVAVRAAAVRSLTAFSPDQSARSAIMACVNDPECAVRNDAIRGLKEFEATPEIIQVLTERLNVEDCDYAFAVLCDTLGFYGQESAQAIPVLLGVLRDQNSTDEEIAVALKTLGEIGQPSPEVIQEISQYLENGPHEVRAEAIVAIAEMGKAADEFVPQLLDMLDANPDNVKTPLIHAALYRLGYQIDEQVEIVIECLDDPDREKQINAARACGIIGLDAFRAVPRLAEMFVNPESAWSEAEIALNRITEFCL